MDEEEQALRKLTELAHDALAEALRRRGFDPRPRGGWLHTGVGQLDVRCCVAGVQSDRVPALAFLALELRPFLDQEEGIRETVIGVGRTPPEAVEHAVEVCLEGVLPPLVAAIAPGEGGRRVSSERLEQPDIHGGGPARWRVFAGPVLATGGQRALVETPRQLETPFQLLSSRDALPVFPSGLALAWMKLVIVRQDGEVSGECRVNNAHWPVGLEVVARSGWPARARSVLLRDDDDDGYFAVRQFVALVPA